MPPPPCRLFAPSHPSPVTALRSVAVDRRTLVVGVQGDESSPGSAVVYGYDPELLAFVQEPPRLVPSDGDAGDDFGRSVSASGDDVLVGAQRHDAEGVADAGAAYLYRREGEGDDVAWTEWTKLVPPDPMENARFGISVAIYGKWAVVGANGDDANGENSGAAYVFARQEEDDGSGRRRDGRDGHDDGGGTWAYEAKLVPDDNRAGDNYGFRERIHETYLGRQGNAVWTFWRCAFAWILYFLCTNLRYTSHVARSVASRSVALHGETAAVSAVWDEERTGSVYVYRLDDGQWTLDAKLAPQGGQPDDQFGWSLSVYEDTIAVGSFSHDANGYDDSGAAYVFVRDDDGDWRQQARITADQGRDDDHFGRSLSLHEDWLVVGAPMEDDGGIESGAAYIYQRTAAGDWILQAKTLPTEAPADFAEFGYAVAASREFFVVSSKFADSTEDDSRGNCYVYETYVQGTTWSPTLSPVTEAPTPAPVETVVPTPAPVETPSPSTSPSTSPIETPPPTSSPVDLVAPPPTSSPVDGPIIGPIPIPDAAPTSSPVSLGATSAPSPLESTMAPSSTPGAGTSSPTPPIGDTGKPTPFEANPAPTSSPLSESSRTPSLAPVSSPDSPATSEPTQSPTNSTSAPSSAEVSTLAPTSAPMAGTSSPAVDTGAPTPFSVDSPPPSQLAPSTGTQAPVQSTPGATLSPTTPPSSSVGVALSCPESLDGVIPLDSADATVYYALVPSDPPGADNGLLCARVEVEADGWVGFGISERGDMVGSVAVIGLPDEGSVLKYRLLGKSEDDVVVANDEYQTLIDPSVTQSGGVTTLEFGKLLVEDGELPILEEGVNQFLLAVGSSNELFYHQTRLSFEKDFSEDSPSGPTDAVTLAPASPPEGATLAPASSMTGTLSPSSSLTTTLAPTVMSAGTMEYDANHGEDSRMIAYLGNWQACPSPEQIDAYSHIVIAFAVSYDVGSPKNVCDEECNVAEEVTVCDESVNQSLVDQWREAGKKVILSFGGAGMGGSWSGDPNNCWDYCFGKEDQLSTQLLNIVDKQKLDGIDIDYEYCYDIGGSQFGKCPQRDPDLYSDIAAQDFLDTLTDQLRTKLDELQSDNGYDRGRYVLTHAPMDTDVASGSSAYFQILQDRSSDLDFVMPQFYNGVTRPALDGIDGTGMGTQSAAEIFGSLSNDMFDQEPNKVVFGFCINDCSSMDSNADATQAAQIMSDLKTINNEEFACNGGAFFWVVDDDVDGKWSDAVVTEVSKTAGCSVGSSGSGRAGRGKRASLLRPGMDL
ncbi:hypothetical protein ACHAWF_012027 [Thalassiosira exigua]